jgi:hypothetical protein
MNAPVYRSRLVEVQIPAGFSAGSELSFPDQADLRNALVTGIEAFNENDLSFGPSGVAAITQVDSLALTVTIAQASDEKVRNVPFSSLIRTLNAGLFREYRNLVPTWQQCNVRAVQNFTAGTPTVALFLVHYAYPSDLK